MSQDRPSRSSGNNDRRSSRPSSGRPSSGRSSSSRGSRDGYAPRGERSDRPSRDGERRPSSRPSRDGDRPARSGDSRGSRDGYAPRGERSDRPSRDGERRPSSRPSRDGDRPARSGDSRGSRDGYAPRGERSDRPSRDGDRRPPRDGERRPSSRPSRDGDRPARSGDSRGSRDGYAPRGERSDRPSRDGDRRPPRDGERRPSSRPGRDGDRPARSGGPRDSRGSTRSTTSRDEAPRKDRVLSHRSIGQEDFVEVAADIDIKILPKQVLAELRNISPASAEYVAKHLAAAMYALEDDDAERAFKHAVAARSRAARLASVREMCGLAAYHSQMWAEALNEFRTFQRLTGDPHFLPLMADCERGLGRPQKALAIARSEQVRSLDANTKIEMRIVASGARRDLGQIDAAIATLECPELHGRGHSEASTRLRYAYAEALLAAGRKAEARDWFVKTTLADPEDTTDAADRALEIDV